MRRLGRVLMALMSTMAVVGCASRAEEIAKSHYHPAEPDTGYYLKFHDDDNLIVFYNGSRESFQQPATQSVLSVFGEVRVHVVCLGDTLQDVYALPARPSETIIEDDRLVLRYEFRTLKDNGHIQENVARFGHHTEPLDAMELYRYLDVILRDGRVAEMRLQFYYAM